MIAKAAKRKRYAADGARRTELGARYTAHSVRRTAYGERYRVRDARRAIQSTGRTASGTEYGTYGERYKVRGTSGGRTVGGAEKPKVSRA